MTSVHTLRWHHMANFQGYVPLHTVECIATALSDRGCEIVDCPIVGGSVKHLCKIWKIASEKKSPWRESNHGLLEQKFYKASVLPIFQFFPFKVDSILRSIAKLLPPYGQTNIHKVWSCKILLARRDFCPSWIQSLDLPVRGKKIKPTCALVRSTTWTLHKY